MRERQVAYPIPISVTGNDHEKKDIHVGWGMQPLVYLICFIICHPFITLHFEEMIFTKLAEERESYGQNSSAQVKSKKDFRYIIHRSLLVYRVACF